MLRKVNLFGSGIKSRSDFITSQRRLNCFYQLRQDGEKNQLMLIGTPGLTAWITLPQGPIRGMKSQGNYLYAVAANTLYAIAANGAHQSMGGLFTSNGSISLAFNETQLMVTDGAFAYYANNYGMPAESSLAMIQGFTAQGANSCICNDGYGIAEQPGSGAWWVSNNQDFSSWNPLFENVMESYSDIIQAVDYVGGGLVAIFGRQSIEYWQDQPQGNDSVPYQRLNGYQVNFGLGAVFGRQQFQGGIAFLGRSQEGQLHIMMIGGANGYYPQTISDPDVDQIINSLPVVSDCVMQAWDVNGQQFLEVTFPTADRSFLYEGTFTQTWSEMQSGVGDPPARWMGQYATTFNNNTYVSDNSTGTIYLLDPTNCTENGAQIKREVVSVAVMNGGNAFSVPWLYLDMEMGVGSNANPLATNPSITMEVSRNNGKTWNTPRPMPLGQQGQYSGRVNWRRCGGTRNGTMKFRFRMTDPADFIIAGAYASMSAGPEG